MQIIDLKNKYMNSKFDKITIVNNSIIYFEEKLVDNNRYLFCIQNDLSLENEKTLFYHKLANNSFFTYTREIIGNFLYIFISQETAGLTVYKISLDSYTIDNFTVETVGKLNFIYALNEKYVFLSFSSDMENSTLFDYYYKIINSNNVMFVLNLEDKTTMLIRDERLFNADKSSFNTFDNNGEKYLLIHKTIVDEKTKYYLYKEQRSAFMRKDEINDIFWRVPINKLMEDISAKKQNCGLEMIISSDIDGYSRFVGVENHFLYYRSKLFTMHTEQYYKMNLQNLDKIVLFELDSDKITENEQFIYKDFNNVYHLKDDLNFVNCTNLMNKKESFSFPNKYGSFIDKIENRYILTKLNYKTSDCYFELLSIYDMVEKKIVNLKGDYIIDNNIIVLY